MSLTDEGRTDRVNSKTSVGVKCFFTGIIYALVTCIIQVPVAEALGRIIDLRQDQSLTDEMLPLLLFFLFLAGMALGLFYYLNGHLFAASSKWKQGLKFSLFVYASNYIAQVLFLDANNGPKALVTGGFPVIQVELFDLIVLVVTVLLMVLYMPCRQKNEKTDKRPLMWKCLVCGLAFSAALVVLNEAVLPVFGFPNMAEGLQVAKENMPFFYSVMTLGFILAGTLVAYYAYKAASRKAKGRFVSEYALLIWCVFDLTMIPLGYGIPSTVAFIAVSLIAFALVRWVCRYL